MSGVLVDPDLVDSQAQSQYQNDRSTSMNGLEPPSFSAISSRHRQATRDDRSVIAVEPRPFAAALAAGMKANRLSGELEFGTKRTELEPRPFAAALAAARQTSRLSDDMESEVQMMDDDNGNEDKEEEQDESEEEGMLEARYEDEDEKNDEDERDVDNTPTSPPREYHDTRVDLLLGDRRIPRGYVIIHHNPLIARPISSTTHPTPVSHAPRSGHLPRQFARRAPAPTTAQPAYIPRGRAHPPPGYTGPIPWSRVWSVGTIYSKAIKPQMQDFLMLCGAPAMVYAAPGVKNKTLYPLVRMHQELNKQARDAAQGN
ncbi:hypothetical protein BDV96DRAFT_594873 [Lophiotrema nucula]|uniref:Uncharacterized protein n=1 Tax=Lophiotrema nucula TaxID=690887 RepID=A0A6A5ZTZ3_9PLEO|nr:hypothetical protein BDV96DRAFT_594873 [Lophiotrema nucula]